MKKNLFLNVIKRIVPRFIKRRYFALSYYKPQLKMIRSWQFLQTKLSQLYYELQELNESDLASLLSLVTEIPYEKVLSFFDELKNNSELSAYINNFEEIGIMKDSRIGFGRRLGWYALVRIMKPKVVIETGVADGLGALVITAALIENAKEGTLGRYYGTEININAGWLFKEPYSNFGEILYGDSIQSLELFEDQIDIFVNDSDHSAEYENMEYECIKNKLSLNSFLLSDNSHVTDSLRIFSNKNERNYVFFKEIPRDHWYPGAGIGISFINK